jgi:hypothetical protein
MSDNKLKLVFSDSFFESIGDLSIEDQQEMIDEINKKFQDGTLLEESTPVKLEDLPEDLAEQLSDILKNLDQPNDKKHLH